MKADDGAWGAGPTVALWAAAYLYGSAPLIYWLGRWARVDLRSAGSGNVGATNLLQHSGRAGKALACVGWVFDASKGALPPTLALALGAPPTTAALAGVLGTAGQCWPATLRFRGGRGISAFVGAAALMDPVAWRLSLAPMIVGSSWRLLGKRRPAGASEAGERPDRSRSVPLGCFIAVALFPVVCGVRSVRGQRSQSIAPLALSAVILLRRLTAALPDDAVAGPRRQPKALLYRLLYDRNTRD
ncbi:MAG TPA: glycerol-3-phosphate acyltransferase [Ktedonobacterales bacterium]|jgi:hypothetical protein